MTAATLSRLPLSAGGALAGSVARGGLWIVAVAIDGSYWLVKQFMRAPVAVSCVAAVAGFSLLAGGNALFMQTERHPAPLFFAPAAHTAPRAAPHVRPVVPAPRPHQRPVELDDETTGSLGVQPTAIRDSIGNDDVLMLQKKLVALALLGDKPDGIFGRRTAAALKAFEKQVGIRPDGRLTREVIDAVLAAPITRPQAVLAVAPSQPAAAAALAPPTRPAAPESPADRKLPLAPAVATGQPVPLAPLPQATQLQTAAAAAESSAPIEKVALAPVVTPTQSVPAATSPAAPPPVAADQPAAAASADDSVRSSAMAMNNPPSTPAPTAVPVSADATPAQKLAAQMGTLPPEATVATAVPEAQETANSAADPTSDPGDGAGSTDPVLITKIQRGLASLGFLGAKIDGVPGEGTAKAIRNFEVFYDYRVTGLATPQLLDLLIQHGATI